MEHSAAWPNMWAIWIARQWGVEAFPSPIVLPNQISEQCGMKHEQAGVDVEWGEVVVLNLLLLIASWLPLLAALSAILHLSKPTLRLLSTSSAASSSPAWASETKALSNKWWWGGPRVVNIISDKEKGKFGQWLGSIMPPCGQLM